METVDKQSPFAEALQDVTRRCERLVQVLSILREMDHMDDPSKNLKTVCCRIVEALASSLAAENCSLFLVDNARQAVELRATCSPFEDTAKYFEPGSWPSGRFRFGEGVAGTVALTRASMRVMDTLTDERFVSAPQGGVNVRSLLGFPLVIDQQLVGVVNLSHSSPGFFTSESEQILSFVAERAARMLANHLMQEHLRDSEEHYRLVAENAGDAILVFSKTGKIVSANAAVETICGISADKFIKGEVSWESCVHPEDRGIFRADQVQLLSTPAPSTIQYRCMDTSGQVHFLEQRSAPFTDSSGRIKGVVSLARDATERKHAEEQLLQAQKMECLGRLTGGVAHDFNNLLTIIAGYSELLRRQVAHMPDAVARLQQVQNAVERASQLTRQLLAFSRKQVLQPLAVDMNQAIPETAKLLERVLGEDIALTIRTAPEPAWVMADPVHLVQVFMNLAVNARDAMPFGGTLTLETDVVDVDEALVGSDSQHEPGRYVLLTVTDSGCGMDVATLAQIWEPFFTTKEGGKGTGLGLSTVLGIITQSGGFVRVHSEPGRGSSFRIYLPYRKEEVRTVAAQTKAVSQRGTETILVVEDEEALRDLIVHILTGAGFRVLAASTPMRAVAVQDEHAEPIDLILTDVVMPQMDGGRLADILRKKRPQIKVLYMSGYAGDVVGNRALLKPNAVLLQKPFTAQELLARIRDVLDRSVPQT